jgi:anti-sigma B factor antagonist
MSDSDSSPAADTDRLNIEPTDYGWAIGFQDVGLIDFHTTEAVGAQLLRFQEQNREADYLIDFHGVLGLSSAMLGKLITLYRRIKADGRKMALCNMGPVVDEMFRSSRLNTWFVCCQDRRGAEAKLKG